MYPSVHCKSLIFCLKLKNREDGKYNSYEMRVLFCGTRDVISRFEAKIERIMKTLNPKTDIIIHGGCKGVDMMCDDIAHKLEFTVEVYPALWSQYGRAAGPIRNQQMLNTGIDRVIAFHPNLDESKGTKDMVNRARKNYIHTTIYGGKKIIIYRYE